MDQVPIVFIPSTVMVQVGTDQAVRATGYECKAALLESPVSRKAVKPIQETAFLEKYNCIDLYFDVPAPSVEDIFKMRVGEVMVHGRKVDIPEITFQKGIAIW